MSLSTYKIPDNFNAIYVCGDIHGELHALCHELKRKHIENAIVIVAGDCGVGFEKPGYYIDLYEKLCKTLQERNICLLLIRGNHDDPRYFEERLLDFPFMKTILDYTIIRFIIS